MPDAPIPEQPDESEWQKMATKALVESVIDAIRRTRYVFLAMNITAVFLLSAIVNNYLPWMRHIPLRDPTPPPHIVSSVNKLMWEDLYTVTMPILGIKYSNDDVILVGPITVCILTLWFAYAARRENHAFGHLAQSCEQAFQSGRRGEAKYLASVVHHFLFTTTTENDRPFGQQARGLQLRRAVKALVFLPTVALVAFIVATALSIVLPFSLSGTLDPTVPLWSSMRGVERAEMIARLLFSTGAATLAASFTWKGWQFDTNTRTWQAKVLRVHSETLPRLVTRTQRSG